MMLSAPDEDLVACDVTPTVGGNAHYRYCKPHLRDPDAPPRITDDARLQSLIDAHDRLRAGMEALERGADRA